MPFMRPRCCFRYLTRLGCSMARYPMSAPRALGSTSPLKIHTLTPIVPYVVWAVATPNSMSARRVWSGTRPSRYHSRRARDPDAVRAQPQRALHRLLHRPPERHPLLELQRDVLGHELGVQLRMDHLLDVEVDLLAGPGLQLVLELLDLGALPPDDDPRPGRVNRDPDPVRRALDVDAGDPRVVERLLDVAPDLGVLVEEVRVVLLREPARAPRPGRAQTEPDRVNLLSHYALLVELPFAGGFVRGFRAVPATPLAWPAPFPGARAAARPDAPGGAACAPGWPSVGSGRVLV